MEPASSAEEVLNRTCLVCSKTFLKRAHLISHMRAHKSGSTTTESKDSIPKRNNKKKKPEFYACHICAKEFSTDMYMKAHIRRFHNRKCSKCYKTFTSKYKMEEHMRDFHGEIIIKEENAPKKPQLFPRGDKRNSTCPVCAKEFDRPHKMKKHWRVIHNKVEDPTKKINRTCPVCYKVFQYKYRMERHALIHERDDTAKRTCPFCSKIFDSISKMSRHKMRKHIYPTQEHVDIRTCDICSKVCATYRDKKQHERLQHSNEPEEQRTCPTCNNVYVNSKNLRAHMRRMHSNVKTEPIEYSSYHDDEQNNFAEIEKASTLDENDLEYRECVLCDKVFKSVQTFFCHFRTQHPGECPFECKVCCKKFKFKINFHKHLKKAKCQPALRMEYRKCPICYKLHNNSIFLKGHMSNTHAGEKPFICTHCEVDFISLEEFENHLYKQSHKCKNDEQMARLDTYKNTIRMGEETNNDKNVELEYRKCAVCYNVHAHQAALKKHMVKHHKGVTPFSCTECERSFKCLKDFERHVLEKSSKCNNHKQAAELQKYRNTIKKGQKKSASVKMKNLIYRKCPVCYTLYLHTKTLRNHMLQHHTDIKPFVCSCKKNFQFLGDFENHLEESKKCDNVKQKRKLQVYKKALKNGIFDKNKKSSDI